MSQAMLTEPLVTIAEFGAFLDAQQDDSVWEPAAGQIMATADYTATALPKSSGPSWSRIR
jgi:hypothetical protein